MNQGDRLLAEYEKRAADWSDIKDHLPFIREQAQKRRQATIIELGTRGGFSTCALLAGAYLSGSTVWSCDRDPAAVPGYWHDLKCWNLITGDDTTEYWRLPKACDVLFVDTSHEYLHTLAEMALYMPRLLPGGIAKFHDTQYESRGPNGEADLGTPDGHVAHALNAWCNINGREWVNRSGSYGLGVISQ